MSDDMKTKKGKNFKEFIAEEKQKGKTTKNIMRKLTSLDSSLVYGGSFLLIFVALATVFYFVLMPGVYIWAGLLVVAAFISSLFASRVTKVIKKNQWKYNA
jgi:hypothetical protein